MKDSQIIWNWIKEAKAAGITVTSSAAAIDALILRLPQERRAALAAEYWALYGQADQLLLWETCSLLQGSPASDDSFEYFRNWLIWGGAEFFARVIAEPDSLTDICEHYGVDISTPYFEALSTLGTYATTESEQHPSREWNWHESSADRISKDLPKLWARYGRQFSWDPPVVPQASSFEAPGLGTIRVGDRVRHKSGYGEGVVTEVLIADTAIAMVKFADESRPVRITSEHYERVT